MKKIYLISALTIILGFIFYIAPHWFKIFWGFQLMVLPITAGILMVLVQNENRSYRFLPKLIAGSLLTAFLFVFLLQVFECFNYRGPHCMVSHIFNIFPFALFLAGVSFFGGLIGLVIRGTDLLIRQNSESKFVLIGRKILGDIFLFVGAFGGLAAIIAFLALVFNPSSSWLNLVMVDFRLIEVTGVVLYYLLLLSVLSITLIPLAFLANLGLKLLFTEKKFINKKIALRLAIYFLFF